MPTSVKDIKARYNANGNAIIPNSFQHPNIFIDRLMYYLTPPENVVLTFAVRRILGFQTNIMSRKDNISLSQFTNGITAEDGAVLCMGCGLSENGVRDALDSLCKYKILLPTTEKPNPKMGQEYWLQDNENQIDWDGLEERLKARQSVNYQRTRRATTASLRVRKGQGSVGRDSDKGSVGRDPKDTSDVSLGVTSDADTKPTETHRNPPLKDNSAAAPHKPDILDGMLDLQFKPRQVQEAIKAHFHLTPNWRTKSNGEFMQWAVAERITPEQVERAASTFRSDKRFNWQAPSLKAIQEHWLDLINPKGDNHANGNTGNSQRANVERPAQADLTPAAIAAAERINARNRARAEMRPVQ